MDTGRSTDPGLSFYVLHPPASLQPAFNTRVLRHFRRQVLGVEGPGEGIDEKSVRYGLQQRSSMPIANHGNVNKSLPCTVNRSPLKWLSKFHRLIPNKGEACPAWRSRWLPELHLIGPANQAEGRGRLPQQPIPATPPFFWGIRKATWRLPHGLNIGLQNQSPIIAHLGCFRFFPILNTLQSRRTQNSISLRKFHHWPPPSQNT